MAIVLFDTNILIDSFAGYGAATLELARYEDAVISVITWMEVACKMDKEELAQFRYVLDQMRIRVIHTNEAIMCAAASIRGKSLLTPPKIALPDAIIRATAEIDGRLLITRNPKDFGGLSPSIRVPYTIVGGAAINIQPPPP